MKAFAAKSLLACSVTAACLFAGASAQAATFNPFTVQPTGPAVTQPFQADKITGNYVETATFNGNAFTVSLYWKAGQFVTNGGKTGLDAIQTGLGFDYGIYALDTASGTVSVVNGVTNFNFTPGTGSLTWYLDDKVDTTLTGPATGNDPVIVGNGSDDIKLASGDPVSGLGVLDPSLSTCTNGSGGQGINCGSFGSKTTFELTDAGKNFFVSPTNFYNVSFQSGQLNNFTPTGTVVINGSLDVVFDNAVPEPASLGLLGLGLLGLGFARRRKQG